MRKVIRKQDNVATAGAYCHSDMGARAGRVAFKLEFGDISDLHVKAPKLAQTAETKPDIFLPKVWEVSIRYA
jgi:hypothetical protein